MKGEPPVGIRRSEKGVNGIGKLDDGERVRVVLCEPEVRQGDEPTLSDLREALTALYGTDHGVHDVTWLSRFTDAARQAVSYRERRVLLAGDAAHVHSPAGGQGLNIGVQDAVNLGWKLAQVVKGTSPETLLDTYHAERHPIGARVLESTLAQTAINRGDERTRALREAMSELLALDEPRKRYAGRMSGLDITTISAPDTRSSGAACPISTWSPRAVHGAYSRCCTALDLCCSISVSPPPSTSLHGRTGWSGSTLGTQERGTSPCSAPSPPTAVLIRPDGYVAWVGFGTDQGLRDALTTWFGPPNDA